MLSKEDREKICTDIGKTVDDVVKYHYPDKQSGFVLTQEPDLTSRIAQQLQNQLDNTSAGNYRFHVIAQSIPDRGPNSSEKITGADLFISISLDGDHQTPGFDKGLLIQSKYDYNINKNELLRACEKMEKQAGKKGSYIWIYKSNGVSVISSGDVQKMEDNNFDSITQRTVKGFAGRILDCYAGSRAWGISPKEDRRKVLSSRLMKLRSEHGVDIRLKRK